MSEFLSRFRLSLLLASLLTPLAVTSCTSYDSVYSGSSYGSEAPSTSRVSRKSVAVEDRPGLGTGWGERRSSQVSDSDFVRSSSSPAAATRVYYNDAAGVSDMSGPGFASRRSFDVGGVATLKVVSSSGRALPGSVRSGRNYVIGEHGERYSIELKNRTSRRIEVVVSVDGLDVLDGKSASTGKRGYVIEPGRRVTIEGWRRNMSSVAAFRFGAVSGSYSARSGAGTRNVGVIGVAAFTEKRAYYSYPYRSGEDRRHAADPFPAGRGFAKPPRD